MSLDELTRADPPIFTEGEDLIVTDPTLPTKLTLQLFFTNWAMLEIHCEMRNKNVHGVLVSAFGDGDEPRGTCRNRFFFREKNISLIGVEAYDT